ncbi:uncharacterized protein PGTG_02617 [Puccinia graminis f. sp. tritici CRL 75-36-700-3]|uniref:DDE Tnp4 domain-containing protein n=1 Tax=Puccinia graminis f. sp. tritici (strain CRL 75-36-700-3 / race SCCL) TaxID=418459 RepID=E3JVV1_PUCGT|nr:uncharacterized protein PGTG_02617 [Puccinia graminis f. sp. tritici CRL 75-36-700-3]EFP76176.2 hypothetical protein PGTG_02617 [Puccinia graminis f. sp. tritici CRL 75-36-700-3]
MRDSDFKQATRTSKSGFLCVLREIFSHPIFQSNSNRPQIPIPHQLALTLERLGSNGNGSSVVCLSRNLSVAHGTVIKITRRVTEALTSLEEQYIKWLNQQRRQEISSVMKNEGFDGCVGFVDGTTIPLFQWPGFNGEVFWDHKKRYSINVQIVCDCDKNIIAFLNGWQGSCGDSLVFHQMDILTHPTEYFEPGKHLIDLLLKRHFQLLTIRFNFWVVQSNDTDQYLLADSAYSLSDNCIPAFKSPATLQQINTDFNYCLAKSWVRNEHAIGILKTCWASLQELQLHLYKHRHMKHCAKWITSCIVLHNMLSDLGDTWDQQQEDIIISPSASVQSSTNSNTPNNAEEKRTEVRNRCVQLNYSKGILPIRS